MKKTIFLTLVLIRCSGLFSQTKPVHRYTDEEVAKLSTYIADLEATDSLDKLLQEKYIQLQNNYKALQGNYTALRDSVAHEKSIKKDTPVTVAISTPEKENIPSTALVYKVQFFSSSEKIPFDSDKFKGIEKSEEYLDDGTYKYTEGEFINKKDATALQSKLLNMGFKDSFIITVEGGKRIAPLKDPVAVPKTPAKVKAEPAKKTTASPKKTTASPKKTATKAPVKKH